MHAGHQTATSSTLVGETAQWTSTVYTKAYENRDEHSDSPA